MGVVYNSGLKNTYNEDDIHRLLKIPEEMLTPAEFLRVFRYKNRETDTGRQKRLKCSDDDVYEVFKMNKKARKSPNQLIKVMRDKGYRLSNSRGKFLFDTLMLKFKRGL